MKEIQKPKICFAIEKSLLYFDFIYLVCEARDNRSF
jgi:hypothetical protein